jgi:NTP pyrophosphatase (non-canonical NTP hydrolase)
MEHFNRLTPAEAERLALLAEECAEVVQAVTKILRHGYDSVHPVSEEGNRETLERELGDLDGALNLMLDAKDVSANRIKRFAEAKYRNVAQYLHHQSPDSAGEKP